MSSIDLTTPREMALKYFGTVDLVGCSDLMEERIASNKARVEFSDLTCDTKLFPYEAQGPFETPLPTLAEITVEIAAEIAKDNRPIPGAVRTVRMGPYMVKFGPNIIIFQEAENLIYLERNSSVRAPKVYAAFASQDADPYGLNERNKAQMASLGDDKRPSTYYYIIMEYIEGCSLGDLVEELEGGPHARKVSKLLGEQFRKLRSVPAEDPELYGRIGGKAFPTIRPFWYPPAPDFNDYGPFDYETLLARLDHTAKIRYAVSSANNEDQEIPPMTRTLYQKARSVLLDNLELNDRLPVLSHLDFGPNNTMVKLVRDKEGEIVDITEVVLIDWESMCWMPAWFEAAQFREYEQSPDDFYSMMGMIGLRAMGHAAFTLGPFEIKSLLISGLVVSASGKIVSTTDFATRRTVPPHSTYKAITKSHPPNTQTVVQYRPVIKEDFYNLAYTCSTRTTTVATSVLSTASLNYLTDSLGNIRNAYVHDDRGER